MRLSQSPTARVGGLFAGYIIACWAAKLVFMTLVTYFYVRNRSPLQDVGDVMRANQMLIYGVAAALYITALQFLYPLATTSWHQVLPTAKAKKTYPLGITAGAIVAVSLLFGTILGGHYNFLGMYIKFDEVALSFVSVVFFILSVFCLTLVDEFILRDKIEPHVTKLLALESVPPKLRDPAAVFGVAVLFVIIKDLQFDLEPIEAINMALLSACLSKVRKETGSYLASAGFAAGFFIVTHAICSLPLFGQDVAGIILIRSPDEKGFGSLLSGGIRGPEDGLALTVLLGIYALQQKFKLRSFGLDRP